MARLDTWIVTFVTREGVEHKTGDALPSGTAYAEVLRRAEQRLTTLEGLDLSNVVKVHIELRSQIEA